ncbi:CDP-alcohol phosphatidyltransferase [Salipaludibacillus keqinensis]|uniref:CDP-alcohol phosphatidyltransferase n=1 Tax=Salipaludibacillus keqinensis TaxID=2045207 RepID=A0A323T912_9BACI|nr:CDP-alcohol phosphatidyltransferase family protein [Salipaludibacillus keqinensis]PYZ91666.1 CDP-alcohol phosphatidyltransferase [Salipaludibacillus keqinensis]
MLDTKARHLVQPAVSRSASLFLKLGFTANQVTTIAFIIGVSSGLFIYIDQPIIALAALWFSGFLDIVDGTMARKTQTSSFGTVLDVSFDRLVEISVILGLAFRYPDAMWILLLLSVSIIYAMTVFLTVGAVSEKSGVKSFYYQPGLAERTEGFILFSLMIAFPSYLIAIAAVFLAVEIFTTLQRLREAAKILK